MGLGFTAEHVLDAADYARPSEAAGRLFDRVLGGVLDELRGTPLETLFSCERDDASLELSLHPGEEPVSLEMIDGLRVRCMARTSSAGPGYHVFALELLERVFAGSGLRWRWTDPDGELGDDTGYQTHRDVERLEKEMFDWLVALSEHVTRSPEGDGGFAISMPLGFQLIGDYFAVSATGFKARTFFERLAEEATPDRRSLAREFFPWWDQGYSRDFWDGLARVLCWTTVPWRPPVNDREASTLRSALDALGKASFEAATERRELEDLLEADPDSIEPPPPSGMGFRRHPMRQPLGDGWTVVVPGYYYREVEDQGNPVFWFGRRTVRVTPFGVRGAERDDLVEQGLEEGLRSEEELRFEAGHLAGRAVVSRVDEDETPYWMLQGVVATDERMVLATICYEDDDDREWAVETWRSVVRPPRRKV